MNICLANTPKNVNVCLSLPSLLLFLQISYTESASGEVTITSGSGYSGNGKEELRKCREAAEQAQKEAEKAVEEHMKSITDMNSDIKKQHENLEKTMRDLNAQVGAGGGVGRVGSGNVLLMLALFLSSWMTRFVSL